MGRKCTCLGAPMRAGRRQGLKTNHITAAHFFLSARVGETVLGADGSVEERGNEDCCHFFLLHLCFG